MRLSHGRKNTQFAHEISAAQHEHIGELEQTGDQLEGPAGLAADLQV